MGKRLGDVVKEGVAVNQQVVGNDYVVGSIPKEVQVGQNCIIRDAHRVDGDGRSEADNVCEAITVVHQQLCRH